MRKDAAFEEGVELASDELRQVGPGGHLCLGDKAGGVNDVGLELPATTLRSALSSCGILRRRAPQACS
jgi:hypothetical protein